MTETKKRALRGIALVYAANAEVVRERILAVLRDRPASTYDLSLLDICPKSSRVGHVTALRRSGRIAVVVHLPNRVGPPIAYYRAVGFEQPDDKEYCLAHHTAVRGLPAVKVAKASDEELEARFEQQLKDAARAKSQKIKPFRCALTEALYGPYVKGKS